MDNLRLHSFLSPPRWFLLRENVQISTLVLFHSQYGGP
uniref:Uncharacterized protein n=1 Tax=Arundo donax TaxID=35708 RepID=A0A0A8Y502_ARUDO